MLPTTTDKSSLNKNGKFITKIWMSLNTLTGIIHLWKLGNTNINGQSYKWYNFYSFKPSDACVSIKM